MSLRAYNQNLVSEVALRLDDLFYEDFEEHIYSHAVYRAERDIAVAYGILERQYQRAITAQDVVDGEFVIEVDNFQDAISFQIGSVTYTRVNTAPDDEETEFKIYYKQGGHRVQYSAMEEGDSVTVDYLAFNNIDDYESDVDGVNVVPILPPKYENEIINKAIKWMSEIGMARFATRDAARFAKYERIFQLNVKAGDHKPELGKSRPWIKMEPYKPL
jgi:hypothetical protein